MDRIIEVARRKMGTIMADFPDSIAGCREGKDLAATWKAFDGCERTLRDELDLITLHVRTVYEIWETVRSGRQLLPVRDAYDSLIAGQPTPPRSPTKGTGPPIREEMSKLSELWHILPASERLANLTKYENDPAWKIRRLKIGCFFAQHPKKKAVFP